MMTEAIIQMTQVSKTFGSGDALTPALQRIDLDVRQGEMVAIMGSSGSGKSTLLTVAGGLEKASEGKVRVAGLQLDLATPAQLTEFRRRSIGFVFQEFNLIPSLTIRENVSLPLELDGWRISRAKVEATNSLRLMEIDHLADRYPTEVSGGQRQRAAIARSFVGTRQVILADEPTGALDSRTGENVARALRNRVDEGATVLLVTHDAKCAAWADRILTIRDGKIVDSVITDRRAESLFE